MSQERFKVITSKELYEAKDALRPIITDSLYHDSPAFIGGMFKTCKSLVAIDAAISIATGAPFLNFFPVPEAMPVVYFSGEGGKAILSDYSKRVAASKGTTEEPKSLLDVHSVHWCLTVPRLESHDDLDAMQEVIRDTAAKVVFIDNTTVAMSGDEASNVMKMGRLFGDVARRCLELGATPVFVHHFKRGREVRSDGGDLQDLTQAGAAELAGQWILLTRLRKYDEQRGDHNLLLKVGGRTGHGGLHGLNIHEGHLNDPGGRVWEVKLRDPDIARQEARDRKAPANADPEQHLLSDVEKLVQAATELEREEHPDGNSMSAIGERSGVRGDRFKKAWKKAVGDRFDPCEIIVSNHKTPSPGFKVRQRDVEA